MYTTAVLAACAAVNPPSGQTLLALIPVVLLALGLMTYCLVDLSRAPSVRYLPKAVWALIIVLVSFPLGAILYLVLGKDHHDRHSSLPRDQESPRSWDPTG